MSERQGTSHYVQIAQIIKAKGTKGQFVAQSCNELFSLLGAEGLEVWIVPPTLRGVRASTIASVEQKPGASDFLLRISGVDDLGAAGELVGRYLLAASALPKGDNRNVPLSPISTSFTDVAAGDLGQLIRLDKTPAYDLWVVDGPHGELLIPAVDEYVVGEAAGLITLQLPKGFLEINKKVDQ